MRKSRTARWATAAWAAWLPASWIRRRRSTCRSTATGIRYKYGLFKQKIEGGFQKEEADDWTRYGDPWSLRREDEAVRVEFADQTIVAVPYDMPIIGYGTDNIGTLRLWQAEPVQAFDFNLFKRPAVRRRCGRAQPRRGYLPRALSERLNRRRQDPAPQAAVLLLLGFAAGYHPQVQEDLWQRLLALCRDERHPAQ